MSPLLRLYKDEAGLRAALGGDARLKPVIEQEMAHYAQRTDRDHAARVHVSMLRRVLGMSGGDMQAEHDTKMREALKRIRPTGITIPADWNLPMKKIGT